MRVVSDLQRVQLHGLPEQTSQHRVRAGGREPALRPHGETALNETGVVWASRYRRPPVCVLVFRAGKRHGVRRPQDDHSSPGDSPDQGKAHRHGAHVCFYPQNVNILRVKVCRAGFRSD